MIVMTDDDKEPPKESSAVPPAVPPHQQAVLQSWEPEPSWPGPQQSSRNSVVYDSQFTLPLQERQDVAVEIEGVAAEGHAGTVSTEAGPAAGKGSAEAQGASTAAATGHAAGEGLARAVSNATLNGTLGEVTLQSELTTGPVPIGRVAIANRDAVLEKTFSIELLLRALVEREKEARPNAGSLPELETILADVVDIRAMLLTTVAAPSEADVGTRALSFKSALINLWNKEHVSILKLGFDATLFFLGLELIAHFGLVNATIMATVIRQKEIPEALKHLSKIIKSMSGGSR